MKTHHPHKQAIVLTFLTVLSLLAPIHLQADELPLCGKNSWLKYHAVYEGKNHSVGVDTDGELEFFMTKRKQRLNTNWPITMKLFVQRRTKGDTKWVTKKVKKDGFLEPKKQEDNPEKLELIGTVTGDVQFKLIYTFLENGVSINGEFVGLPKDANEADYRMIVHSDIDELVYVQYGPSRMKDLKKKVRGHELTIETRKNRPHKARFDEPLNSEEVAKAQITEMELKASKTGSKKFTWKLSDRKAGVLDIEPKVSSGYLYKGFIVSSVLIDTSGQRVGDGISVIYE